MKNPLPIIEINDIKNFDLGKIDFGIIIIKAEWSGGAALNLKATVNHLNEINFTGQIFIIDIDCMNGDYQKKNLGSVSHGWGDIFLIRHGQIQQAFLGKDCYTEFKHHAKLE